MPLATDPETGTAVDGAPFAELAPRRLHDLLRLRAEVFVVEQACVFLDIDGRDHEPDAEHLWIDDDAGVAAALRLLREDGDTWSIGRIATRVDARERGLGAVIVRAGLERLRAHGCRTVRIGAQAQLAGWYRRLGFEPAGPRYLEDGILHLPMAMELVPS